ncbi:MAG TPA: TRAP transporter small permease [Thermodesulfobacteriota bacterium]|nr:TRAP transporter small permease [Thermodesulfobacteriota bacterium]
MGFFRLPPGPPAPGLIRWLGMIVDHTVVAIGAVMVVLVFCNVVMHVLRRDIAWTTEFCEFMMVWATFLGGASLARRGGHMTITELLEKLSGVSRRRADAAIQLFSAAILVILVWYGMGIVQANWGNVLTVLEWPMALQYLGLPVGSAVMLVFVGYDFIQIIRGKSREERYGG